MKKIFAILVTAVLMLTILALSVSAEGGGKTTLSEGSTTRQCVPGIEVTKTVWDNESKTWEKEITAKFGDNVTFNSTIHNSGSCNLTNIVVTDTLSDSFKFEYAIPMPDGEDYNPLTGITTLTWYLTGQLVPCETMTYLINVTVIECGVDTNTQYAEAEGCGEIVSDEDTATVNVPGEPGIEVTKTVLNETAGEYEDSTTADLNDTVHFRCKIHNNGTCADLTDIDVTDILSKSLNYTSADPEPDTVTHNPDGTTVLKWFLPGPLAPCDTETFWIDATVIGCGVDTNTQSATADCGGEIVSDEDTATVIVQSEPGMEAEKTVWNGTAWVNDITAKLDDIVQFNLTIDNTGACCLLTNIEVIDTLPGGLEYISATPEPTKVLYYPDHTEVIWYPGVFAPYRTLPPANSTTFIINAKVTECGDSLTNDLYAEAVSCGQVLEASDYASVDVPGVPGIEVNKTVFDPETGEWVDEIEANVCEIVRFRCEIHNNGTCCPLTDIVVTDILSDSLVYADNATVDGVPWEPEIGPNEFVWAFLEWWLEPCETITIEFDAHVVKCGVDINTQYAEAWSPECEGAEVYDEDTATVVVPERPSIEVNKTVWDNENGGWVDNITANLGDTVQFNSTIHNNGTCCDLTNIKVWDILSDSLNYTSAEPEPQGVVHNPIDGTTTLTWYLTGPLVPCERETFIINAKVTKCGVDTNTQYAEAEGCEEIVSDEDTATVYVRGEPDIEVNKTVWNGTAWVNEITAKLNDVVQFNSTIHNNGTCCDLRSINVTDTLSPSLEYISAIPVPDGVCYNCPPGTGKTVLTWFLPDPLAPCETETFIINARVIDCGEDTNTQNATAVGCGQNVSDEATATVYVPVEPGIEVNKTVWDGNAWVDNITVNLNDTVRFRCEMHNNGTCCPLTYLCVRDELSSSLEYANNATVQYPNGTTVPMEPNGCCIDAVPMQSKNCGLEWWFPDLNLKHCETITIEFDARVIDCGVDTNTQSAEAWSDECEAEVFDQDTATVTVRSEPGMEVVKTVWNGSAWVKEITAKLGDIVEFNSTIYNTGACCPLTNIAVWDILTDSLEYLNAIPEPDNVIHYPNGTTKIIWFPGAFAPMKLPPVTSKTFFINATVIECGGVDTNTQYAEAVSCGELLSGQDTATVNVPGVPEIEVNKTVWNETAEAWEDSIAANVSDTVRFKCEIHNNGTCCPLTDIVVTDILSDSLEYADTATVNGEPWEPTFVNPNEFKWEFPDLVLEHCETITIEFDTHVVKCGVDENLQKATAVGCGKTVSDEDTATVTVTGKVKPGIEVEKTVWNGTAWVDKINASIGDTVKFNSTVHNNGTCCNLTDIEVTDTLSDGLEYISAIPAPDGVTHNPDGTTTLIWFFSGPLVQCETITLLIDADVTKYGEASNKQNATAVACDGTTVSDEDYAYVSAILKPDLVITDEWLCWPDTCTICYNVTNIGEGTAPACHNTTLYVDGVAVAHDHVPVDLAPGESYIGCFDDYIWAYTTPSDNITVCADNNETVNELDEDNNCLTNIWMCGDVNGDGKVTMSDVVKVFNRYLDPNYPLALPWAADVYCDGEVTMSDVVKVFNRYLDPEYELNCCCKVVE